MELETIKKRLGRNLKQARQAAGLTQAELAELCDVTQQRIWAIEEGSDAYPLPSLNLVQRLELVLKTNLLK